MWSSDTRSQGKFDDDRTIFIKCAIIMLINDKPIFMKWYLWETAAWLIFMIICYTINYLFFMDSHYSQSWLILLLYSLCIAWSWIKIFVWIRHISRVWTSTWSLSYEIDKVKCKILYSVSNLVIPNQKNSRMTRYEPLYLNTFYLQQCM